MSYQGLTDLDRSVLDEVVERDLLASIWSERDVGSLTLDYWTKDTVMDWMEDHNILQNQRIQNMLLPP